jgi:type I restriction enzyme M protein
MTTNAFKDIEKLETDLWEAADNLRANSKLTSSDYFMPVLGVIFLRHAANRFDAAHRQIEADQASGKMPPRKVLPADYIARRSLFLPIAARYDWIMEQAAVSGTDLPRRVTEAMTAIESTFEPLKGVLPKDYGIFEPKVLEDLMRLFNSERIRQATGDVFGRIYEYFLAKFSIQKAHDNGEFFTPSSLVQMIVNVIEPDHGMVFDPACGSGGMFVQSSHFIEDEGGDTAKKVVFHGQEKNRDTIRIAKMNLAVHGLEGKIAEAITYYQDEHNLAGRCDFVMANPPFNVDLVDAEQHQGRPAPALRPAGGEQAEEGRQRQLPVDFLLLELPQRPGPGRLRHVLPGLQRRPRRKGCPRKKLVETGDVDVMIAIRSNFFYTRTVPCELWHFDRAKPPERRDNVLMLDARNVYRKVTRKIVDFSPEQMHNLAAIVWLYRGQRARFLGLVERYLERVRSESAAVAGLLAPFEATLADLRARFDALANAVGKHADLEAASKQALTDALTELREAATLYQTDRDRLLADLAAYIHSPRPQAGEGPGQPETWPASLDGLVGWLGGPSVRETNAAQHAARRAFAPHAEALRGLVKQVDLLYKLTARVADALPPLPPGEGRGEGAALDRRASARLIKQLDEQRKATVEQLKQAVYFHRQVAWLHDRFPDAELADVPGLVKLVSRAEIEAADWSLTPGRYVGVAPPEEDENFDFEQTLRDIHTELADLNREAAALAARIQENFEELM